MFSILVPRGVARRAAPALERMAARAVPRSRVLVVDNDDEVLRAMQAVLSGWDCEVLVRADDAQARQLVAASTPDHAAARLPPRRRPHRPDAAPGPRACRAGCPCAIITADHSEAVRQEVLAAGCQLLYKPLKPLALKSVMARFLAARDSVGA
jgi:CheY-like chemotaxis protein